MQTWKYMTGDFFGKENQTDPFITYLDLHSDSPGRDVVRQLCRGN